MTAPTPKNEEERMQVLKKFKILDTPAEDPFDDLTYTATQICKTPVGLISLLDETRQWFKSNLGFNIQDHSREHSFCAHVIDSPDVFIVPDTLADERFSNNRFVIGPPHIRFYAGVPLVAKEGHVLGALCVLDYIPRTLTEGQTTALQSLSRVTMTLLELRLHSIELHQSLSKIKILHGLLPICGWCRRVRDDHGYLSSVLDYIEDHSEVQIAHWICPECSEKDRLLYEERMRFKEQSSLDRSFGSSTETQNNP